MMIPPQRDEFSDLAELLSREAEFGDDGIDRRARRARIRRVLLVIATVIAVMIAAVGGYVAWALNAPVSSPAISAVAPRAPIPEAATVYLPPEGASAISVSGADEYLGPAASGTWLASGSDQARPIASISKLVTALVVLEASPLDDAEDPGPTITFDKADHDLYDKYYVMGATIAAMPIGSSMSQRDALATMLIPSASNYAEAVSTWAFGSQSAFLAATRSWLAKHSLAGTTIVEPTGIDSRNASTPSDLLQIGRLAAANPTIAAIAATPSVSLRDVGRLYTTNDLLGRDGVTGLKTGNLGDGSYALLYTASVEVGAARPLSVVGVVLGGYTRDSVNATVRETLNSIRKGFHEISVAEGGEDLGSVSTPWGSAARVVLGQPASIFTWSDTPITVTMQTHAPASYKDGEIVGTVTWTAGPNTVSAPLKLEGSIAPPTDWWRLTHPSELGGQ